MCASFIDYMSTSSISSSSTSTSSMLTPYTPTSSAMALPGGTEKRLSPIVKRSTKFVNPTSYDNQIESISKAPIQKSPKADYRWCLASYNQVTVAAVHRMCGGMMTRIQLAKRGFFFDKMDNYIKCAECLNTFSSCQPNACSCSATDETDSSMMFQQKIKSKNYSASTEPSSPMLLTEHHRELSASERRLSECSASLMNSRSEQSVNINKKHLGLLGGSTSVVNQPGDVSPNNLLINNSIELQYGNVKQRYATLKGTTVAKKLPIVRMSKDGFYLDSANYCIKCFKCDFLIDAKNCESYEFVQEQHQAKFPRCGEAKVESHVDTRRSNTKLIDTVNSTQDDGSLVPQKLEEAELNQPVLKNLPNAVLFDLRKLCTKPEYLDAAIDKRTAGSGMSYSSPSELMKDVLKIEEMEMAKSLKVKVTKDSNHTTICTGFGNILTEKKRQRKKVPKSARKATVVDFPPSPSLIEMESQAEDLLEKNQCRICVTEDISVVFLPCGHMCSCNTCAAVMRHCPICRTLIDDAVTIYPLDHRSRTCYADAVSGTGVLHPEVLKKSCKLLQCC